MQVEVAESTQQSSSGFRTIRRWVCWIYSVALLVFGLASLSNADGWVNEFVAGLIRIFAGVVLLPPALQEIRKRFDWAKPVYAPVAFAILLGVMTSVASTVLAPSPERQMQLQRAAMVSAEKFLAQGNPSAADFSLRRFRELRNRDAALDALLTRIEASKQTEDSEPLKAGSAQNSGGVEQEFQDPASLYSERLQTYWIPQAKALPDSPPEAESDFGKFLTEIDGLVLIVEDGAELALSDEQEGLRKQLVEVLGEKQLKILPVLRARYAETLDRQLFRRDIRVSADGKTLRLVGRPFVRNANIEDVQATLRLVAFRLRFTQVQYQWNAQIGDIVSYRLSPPADGTVSRWDGNQFVPSSN